MGSKAPTPVDKSRKPAIPPPPPPVKGATVGRKQDDINRIAQLEQQVMDLEHTVREVGSYLGIREPGQLKLPKEREFRLAIGNLMDIDNKKEKELGELRTFMRKVKQWVKELPIEARVDMPELQP